MGSTLRVGVVGCGDVFHRSYLPVLRRLRETGVAVTAVCDARSEAAERAAAAVDGPDTVSVLADHRELIGAGVDAAFNLTPAPLHGAVSADLVEAGIHVFSEKPIAGTMEEADRLIEAAGRRGVTLMCAPAVAATARFRWLRALLASGRLGTPTLATSTFGDLGPTAWREYTGDPRVFFSAGVGPLVDQGVYALHGITSLFGPARAVQAMGGISMPRRLVRGGRFAGEVVEVRTPDHVLVHLDFGGDRFAELMSSFAVPASRAPWMEIHCTQGSLSIPAGGWEQANGPVDVYLDDEGPLGLEGWMSGVRAPQAPLEGDTIGTGPRHFLSCLRNEGPPVLTAEHARHVLEILLETAAALSDGTTHPLRTSF